MTALSTAFEFWRCPNFDYMRANALLRRIWHEIVGCGYNYGIGLMVLFVAYNPYPPFGGKYSAGMTTKYFVTEPLSVKAICPLMMRDGCGRHMGMMYKECIVFIRSLTGPFGWCWGAWNWKTHEFVEKDLNSITQNAVDVGANKFGSISQDVPVKRNADCWLDPSPISHSKVQFWAGPSQSVRAVLSEAINKRASAVTDSTGRFLESFSHWSFTALPAATISIKMPNIRNAQPTFSKVLCGLYDCGIYRSSIHPAIFSMIKPAKTEMPPIVAQSNSVNSPSNDGDIDEATKLILFWRVCETLLITICVFGVALVFLLHRR